MLFNVGLLNASDGFARSLADDFVIRLSGDRNIVGRSLVVHEGAPRIAQCVIGVQNPAIATKEDCAISWGEWGECHECDGMGGLTGSGVEKRHADVIVYPINGGEPCPALVEERECNCGA